MNAERLRGIVDFLLGVEEKEHFQDKLNNLRSATDALVGNPADQNAQRNAATALGELETAVNSFYDALSPAQQKNITEAKAGEYFSRAMAAELSSTFAKSGMTPAVVQQQIQKLIQNRQEYLDLLRTTQSNLDLLGIRENVLVPGEVEIGFVIPRELFGDNLGDLQDELKTLNSIIRTFYEISNITPEPVVVRQVSTSDFVIFLEIAVPVLLLMGKIITWCIETIKSTLEIRNIVNSAKAASLDPTLIESLEKQVEKKIETEVASKVKEMLTAYQGDPHRKTHLEGRLERSLDQLLERVANGVTVEIRMLPPAAKDGDVDPKVAAQYDELAAIAKSLDFPQIPPGQPLLQITKEDTSKKAE
jgi:hypothetical protein